MKLPKKLVHYQCSTNLEMYNRQVFFFGKKTVSIEIGFSRYYLSSSFDFFTVFYTKLMYIYQKLGQGQRNIFQFVDLLVLLKNSDNLMFGPKVNCLSIQIYHLLFLLSDDIIRLFEENGRLLNKIGYFVLTISLDLMKSSEVRKAGDHSE